MEAWKAKHKQKRKELKLGNIPVTTTTKIFLAWPPPADPGGGFFLLQIWGGEKALEKSGWNIF